MVKLDHDSNVRFIIVDGRNGIKMGELVTSAFHKIITRNILDTTSRETLMPNLDDLRKY